MRTESIIVKTFNKSTSTTDTKGRLVKKFNDSLPIQCSVTPVSNEVSVRLFGDYRRPVYLVFCEPTVLLDETNLVVWGGNTYEVRDFKNFQFHSQFMIGLVKLDGNIK